MDQQTLVRLVATKTEDEPTTWIVLPDLRGSLPGRGAHLHPSVRCLDQAKRRRAFGRALRVEGPINLSPVEELAESWTAE